MLKVIRASRKSMPQFQQPFFFLETWDLSQISRPNMKNKNATIINALIGSIFWNKNISCYETIRSAKLCCIAQHQDTDIRNLCTVVDSTVVDNTVIDSTVIESTVVDSPVVDRTVEESTVVDSPVVYSTVEDITVVDSAVEDITVDCSRHHCRRHYCSRQHCRIIWLIALPLTVWTLSPLLSY